MKKEGEKKERRDMQGWYLERGEYEGRDRAYVAQGGLIVSGKLDGSCPIGPTTSLLPLYTAT
jgi:hypothetical protein